MTNTQAAAANAEGLIEVGRVDLALPVLKGGLAAAPQDPSLLLLLTRAYIKLSRGADAVATAEQLLAITPSSAQAHWVHALALCEQWRFRPSRIRRLAVPAAEEAVRLAPVSAEAHHMKSYCLALAARPGWAHRDLLIKARESALEALRWAPNWVPPILLLVDIERGLGNRKNAARYAETALSLDPTDSQVLLSAIDNSSFSRRRTLALRLAAVHPSQVATDLVLRTHKPLPVFARLVGYFLVGWCVAVGDSISFGELRPGPDYLWVVGPAAGGFVAILGVLWRRRSLAGFDPDVRNVVFHREQRLVVARRILFAWLMVLPVLWIPSSVVGGYPSAMAVAWLFTGLILALVPKPRFGMAPGS